MRHSTVADVNTAPQTSSPGYLDAAALFRAHGRFVARMLHRSGVAASDVDDLVQDAFLVAHRRGGFDTGPAKPTTWLAQIALRIASNYRRRRKPASAPLEDRDVQGGIAADSNAPTRRAQDALWKLDEGKRLVFMLFELEGVPCDEIATALGIPVGTVYSRLTAARKAFVAAVREETTP